MVSPLSAELVTLDPDTANHQLILSEGGRRVRWTPEREILPAGPKRFTSEGDVLGREGFLSGRHYWEVQLLQAEYYWVIGVARESVSRREGPLMAGIWALSWYISEYQAITDDPSSSSGYSEALLALHDPPRKLGMFLDYEAGRLSLYNTETLEHLHTFTEATFSGRVLPYFHLSQTEIRII
ncbi:hypothetical protein NDU88_007004 [Pleurodeles waltl]|uniref:B30.2/SPRY domain-containing protein n=1 Tax=Pleurodeles waltl TaxID=8319 RepID=A0AAV7WFU1_PLEWA|nr:hypothetical protein NDU88_007004 [Pleurodeles waltl]